MSLIVPENERPPVKRNYVLRNEIIGYLSFGDFTSTVDVPGNQINFVHIIFEEIATFQWFPSRYLLAQNPFSHCLKIWTRKTPNRDTSHAVSVLLLYFKAFQYSGVVPVIVGPPFRSNHRSCSLKKSKGKQL